MLRKIFLLLLLLVYFPRHQTKFTRTLDLSYLVDLLNSGQFSENVSINEIIKEIFPWIIAESGNPIKDDIAPPVVSLNCSDTMYANIFDGNTQHERIIVDFVPFGYDLDKLEMRLFEGYDIVSAFVVYESPLTQTAKPKPFYFEAVKDTSRFARFKDKIIYLKANISNLSKYIHPSGRKSWKLENSMRYEIIRLFKSMKNTDNNYELKSMIIAAAKNGNALGIQNDADELILRHALYHLSQCKFREHLNFPIYTPCLAFKKNFHWIQTNLPGEHCLSGTSNMSAVIKRAIWTQGPRLWPLKFMLDEGNTLRHVGRNVPGDKRKNVHCKSNTGVFSAIHLSSVAEPAEEWLKAISVIESQDKNILSSEFLSALKHHNLTADIIFRSSMKPWCVRSKLKNKASSGMTFSSSLPISTQRLVKKSIPWIVRKFPKKFPFFVPAMWMINSSLADVLKKTFDPIWVEECKS